MRFANRLIRVLVGILLLSRVGTVSAVEIREPERATGVAQVAMATGQHYALATANPYASEAAQQILRQGGSAVDAAIAAQWVLNLVEPQSSGLGGGGFLLHYDAKTSKVSSFNGREIAPLAADPTWFYRDGKPMAWFDAFVGGKSVGVPGLLAMLYEAHQAHGRLPWKVLFEPAIKLAQNGFVVSPRLAQLLAQDFHPGLKQFDDSRDYFFPDGQPLQAGALRRNPELAQLFAAIAEKGPEAFYQGPTAEALVARVNSAPLNPGQMQLADLERYRVLPAEPLCGEYRGYRICGMGLPSSGTATLLQSLTMLGHYQLGPLKSYPLEQIHLLTQVTRLSFADRNRYLADPRFVDVPLAQMLAPAYLAQRAALIGRDDLGKAEPGEFSLMRGDAQTPELPSTTHLSIVDAAGNAVSMTTSIEMGFGSGLMVQGFLLNNQLTDFSLSATDANGPVANRVEAGKQPLSSMSPLLVFDPQGRLDMVIGSPGGSRIINYVLQALVAHIDWQLPLEQLLSQPHFSNRNDYTALERGTPITAWEKSLKQRGHDVRIIDMNSGLHVVQRIPQGWQAGADPRREGEARAK